MIEYIINPGREVRFIKDNRVITYYRLWDNQYIQEHLICSTIFFRRSKIGMYRL